MLTRRYFHGSTLMNNEKKEFTDISQTVQNCIRAFSQKNNVVINLPPDKNGKLSEGDIEHLEKIVKGINSYVK